MAFTYCFWKTISNINGTDKALTIKKMNTLALPPTRTATYSTARARNIGPYASQMRVDFGGLFA